MPREGFWPPQYEIRLRIYVSLAALAALLAICVTLVAFVVAFSWPETDVGSPTARVYAGKVDDFEVAKPRVFPEGKFWLVKKEDGSFIALYWKAPTLRGCTVPWRDQFSFPDPKTGERTRGWFRDPCSGATWDVNGVAVFGPTMRNLDQFPIEIVADKVYVLATEQQVIRGESRMPILRTPDLGEGNSSR